MSHFFTFPKLSSLPIAHKRVFLRADLNVPIIHGTIADDSRLKALLPTLHYIKNAQGKVILATHLGRPEATNQPFFDPHLSTQLLVSWFEHHGLSVTLERDLKKAILKSKEDFSTILLLENLRFYVGERDTSTVFADLLSQLADLYVNDAFGMMHRHDTSVTMLAERFSPENRSLGLLGEKEIHHLSSLQSLPSQPYTVIAGGKKVVDKLPELIKMVEKPEKNRPTTILLGGPLAYTVLKSKGIAIGDSMYSHNALKEASDFLQKAAKNNVTVILPVDHLVMYPGACHVELSTSQAIPETATGSDIGPETVKLFCEKIRSSQSIFISGPVGLYENPKTAYGTRHILECIATTNAYKVAGGGDMVAAINKYHLASHFNFLSTGGSSTLAFLASENPLLELPGLASILKDYHATT